MRRRARHRAAFVTAGPAGLLAVGLLAIGTALPASAGFRSAGLAASCDTAPTHQIAGVQGPGAATPLAGQAVRVEGVVTGDFQGTDQLSGFYIQDPTPDADPATSDGLFVFSTLAVAVGDRVLASGTATEAARAVATTADAGPDIDVVDLSGLAPLLLSPERSALVEDAVELVTSADVVMVASPTFKGTYTGLLKVFLDRLPPAALAGTVALPLLLLGAPQHALAVEVHLRPLLVELGATVPTPGLALLESQLDELDAVLGEWAGRIAPVVRSALSGDMSTSR